MAKKPTAHRNLWSLTLLSLLREGPMNPHEMRRLVRERKKDLFLDLKPGSMYHAIYALERVGLIEPVVKTTRKDRPPQRTDYYRLTRSGKDELTGWLRELLAKPVHEPSRFFAAVSLLSHLAPPDVVEQLTARAGQLESEIADDEVTLREIGPRIGRLVILEFEYTHALRQAELTWVRSLIEELKAGGISWSPEARLRRAGPTAPAQPGGPRTVSDAKQTAPK